MKIVTNALPPKPVLYPFDTVTLTLNKKEVAALYATLNYSSQVVATLRGKDKMWDKYSPDLSGTLYNMWYEVRNELHIHDSSVAKTQRLLEEAFGEE